MGSWASISIDQSIDPSIHPTNQTQQPPQQEKKLFEDNECRRIDLWSMQSIASFKGLNIFFVSDTTHEHNAYHNQVAAAAQRG